MLPQCWLPEAHGPSALAGTYVAEGSAVNRIPRGVQRQRDLAMIGMAIDKAGKDDVAIPVRATRNRARLLAGWVLGESYGPCLFFSMQARPFPAYGVNPPGTRFDLKEGLVGWIFPEDEAVKSAHGAA